jgi:lupus La protein
MQIHSCLSTVEFYFSDANLPFDKFMFLQTSPHLDSVKAPNLSAEAKQKAEEYGPGCSPVLLQTVASFKRMRAYSSKFPTSKLARIIQTSTTTPKLVDVETQELDGKPTYYIRRILKLEETNRAGVSDRSVYVKGFLSDEDLAKGEPADIQVQLEQWARKWGPIDALRMRRDDKAKGAHQENVKARKPWKNSVFVEFSQPNSAEQLVHDFKKEGEKIQFNGRELSSVMFKYAPQYIFPLIVNGKHECPVVQVN